jgi:hypothetical protein
MSLTRLGQAEIAAGRRVYIRNADVFGTVNEARTHVVCEHPMPGFEYVIAPSTVLYDAAETERHYER